MSVSLTPRQLELLRYIQSYQAAYGGISPSYDECRHAVGLASKAGIFRLMSALEERGHIRRMSRRSRAIEIVTPLPELSPEVLQAIVSEQPPRHVERSPRASETMSRAVVVPCDVLRGLAPHAERRSLTVNALVRDLLAAISDDGLVDSVLDDADQAYAEAPH